MRFRVTAKRRLTIHEVMTVNPFGTIKVERRTWEFDTDSEEAVRDIWRQGQEQKIPQVVGFELETITQLNNL